MKKLKITAISNYLLIPGVLLCSVSIAHAASSLQIGVGYGRDFRSDADLEQYELFLRKPLPYVTRIGGMVVSTDLEFGMAMIREWDTSGSGTARFSVMPQVILHLNNRFGFLVGVGAGFMVGDTKFGNHDLGGPLLFSGKVGVQLNLDENWGVEYTFYHQSNGSIYSDNYSLDMQQLALTYTF